MDKNKVLLANKQNKKNENENKKDKCTWCYSKWHKVDDCRFSKNKDRIMYKCTYCTLPWYETEECGIKNKDDDKKTNSNMNNLNISDHDFISITTVGYHT